MLLTPRTYLLGQTPDAGSTRPEPSYFLCGTRSQKELDADKRRAIKMLLLHQTGSVKVGEVVRYVACWCAVGSAARERPKTDWMGC
jgi:hypothetical protein